MCKVVGEIVHYHVVSTVHYNTTGPSLQLRPYPNQSDWRLYNKSGNKNETNHGQSELSFYYLLDGSRTSLRLNDQLLEYSEMIALVLYSHFSHEKSVSSVR